MVGRRRRRLVPTRWTGGKFHFNDCLIESIEVGTIKQVDVDEEDDADE